MRNRWYERGKQWFTARYRRQTDRSNKAQVKTDNQEEQRFFSRITSKLKSDNPYALRRQFALRVVAFCLLLGVARSEEHTSELQSRGHLVCRLLLEKKKHKLRETVTTN